MNRNPTCWRTRAASAAVAGILVLTACGGSPDAERVASTPPPPPADLAAPPPEPAAPPVEPAGPPPPVEPA
ncbi:MAG: hypothetical protein F4062_02715, partial [Acidimicrobiia bacterium]|nr:hypothetical protein [Acidimicrobiia bacterium]